MARETDFLLRSTTSSTAPTCTSNNGNGGRSSINFIIDENDDPGKKRTQRLVRVTLVGVIFLILAIMTILALRPTTTSNLSRLNDGSSSSSSSARRSATSASTTNVVFDSSAFSLDRDMTIDDTSLHTIPIINDDQNKNQNLHRKSNDKFHRSRYNDLKLSSNTPLLLTTTTTFQANDDDVELSEIEISAGMMTDERLEGTTNHHKHNDMKVSKCNNGKYSKHTLKRAYEMPFAALFVNHRHRQHGGTAASSNHNHNNHNKFEASDVIVINGTTVYAVCDSLWSISQFDITFPAFSPTSIQIGRSQDKDDDEEDEEEDSGYEAILYDDGHLYVIRESILHHTTAAKGGMNAYDNSDDDFFPLSSSSDASSATRTTYHAVVEQLQVHDMDHDDENDDHNDHTLKNRPHYSVMESCVCEYEFEGDSKGFEGAIAVHDLHGTLTILGLCEGNHCSETRKKDKGHGRIIVMQKVYTNSTIIPTTTTTTSSSSSMTTATCLWKTIRSIPLPESVQFTDYSAISLDTYTDRIAVTTQEDSQLYVGKLLGKDVNTGLWDLDALEFDRTDVSIYDFPKNNNCETIYCNIEGIHWLNDNMLIAVSDKMKSKGRQDFRCFDKDQSVHAFVLP